jgi:hypothetical protein
VVGSFAHSPTFAGHGKFRNHVSVNQRNDSCTKLTRFKNSGASRLGTLHDMPGVPLNGTCFKAGDMSGAGTVNQAQRYSRPFPARWPGFWLSPTVGIPESAMKRFVIGHKVGNAWRPEQAFTANHAECPSSSSSISLYRDVDDLALLCRAQNRSRHIRHASPQLSHTRKYPKAAARAARCDASLVKPIDAREPSSQLTDFAGEAGCRRLAGKIHAL